MIPLLLLFGVRGTLDRLPLSLQRYQGEVSSIPHLNLIHGNPYYELFFSWENTIEASDSFVVKKFLQKSSTKIPKWFATAAELDDNRKFRGTDEATFHIEYQVPALREKHLKQNEFIFWKDDTHWNELGIVSAMKYISNDI